MKKDSIVNIKGQLSIFDLEVIGKPHLEVESKSEFIKKDILCSIEQEKVIENYMGIANRIVLFGMGLHVEIKEKDKFKTLYFNKEGKEEFVIDRKAPIHPFAKILYSEEDLQPNELQIEKAKSIEGEALKRYGDENIIIKNGESILSVLPNGWILEYKNIDMEESYKRLNLKESKKNQNLDVSVGDLIEAEYHNENIIAEITRIYNSGHTANIVWDKKHTAIAVCGIKRIVKRNEKLII